MGNFTLAAQAANITQSAFSAQMKKLERLVGVKLIARSTVVAALQRKVRNSYRKQSILLKHWNVLFIAFVWPIS